MSALISRRLGFECNVRRMIRSTSMIHIPEKDQPIPRLEFRRDCFFIIGNPLVVPKVRTGNHDRRSIFLRRFRHGRHATDHDGLRRAGEVVVPAGLKSA